MNNCSKTNAANHADVLFLDTTAALLFGRPLLPESEGLISSRLLVALLESVSPVCLLDSVGSLPSSFMEGCNNRITDVTCLLIISLVQPFLAITFVTSSLQLDNTFSHYSHREMINLSVMLLQENNITYT